jgi:hypothetical protein
MILGTVQSDQNLRQGDPDIPWIDGVKETYRLYKVQNYLTNRAFLQNWSLIDQWLKNPVKYSSHSFVVNVISQA